MYGGSDEELRAAEMAGRVFDNLSIMAPPEMHGIRQMHTSHVGGASLDRENETAYGSHNTSSPSAQQQDTPPSAAPGGHMHYGVSSLVEIARRESILRQLYSDKLRGSIHAVFSALVNELPRDHVFLQLLNDETTHQYCKVRVGEVVEGFLFSVQAHQYHNLAAELSKREVEVLTLRGQLEALEQKAYGPGPLRSFKTTQTDNRTDCGINTVEPAATVVSPSEVAQPDDLIALLEEVTREHELAKCRECLCAPASLLATVHAEKEYGDKHEYLADIVAHLFRSVQGFVSYAESSLDSIESIRHGLGDVNGGDSSAHVHAPPASPLEEERIRLATFAEQVQTAQRHCADLISALSRTAVGLQRERDEAAESARRAQLQFVEHSNNAQEMHHHAIKTSEAALVQLRGDMQRLLAAEREAAQRDARHAADETLSAARAACEAETQRAQQLEAANEKLRRGLSVAQAHYFTSFAEAARAAAECLTHKSRAAKLELLIAHAYAPVVADQLFREHISREAVRHMEARAEMEARALRDHETAAQLCHNELRQLLSEMREDEQFAESERCAAEAETLSACEAPPATDRDDAPGVFLALFPDDIKQKQQQLEEEADEKDEKDAAAAVRLAHGISATLPGAAAALRAAYAVVRRRQSQSGAKAKAEAAEAEWKAKAKAAEAAEAGWKAKAEAEAEWKAKAKAAEAAKAEWKAKAEAKAEAEAEWKAKAKAAEAIAEAEAEWKVKAEAKAEAAEAKAEAAKAAEAEWKAKAKAAEAAEAEWQRRAKAEGEWQAEAKAEAKAEAEAERKAEAKAEAERKAAAEAAAAAAALRGLLARQEALVAAVNAEREALRARWSALSEDYRALERRNAQLHERCAAKEVENARLAGYISTRNMSAPASAVPSVVDESVERMEKETPEARAPAQRSESSATAGLSAPARTSCSSTNAADEGSAWRSAFVRRE